MARRTPYRFAEIGLMAVVLIGLGILRFSRLTEEEQLVIELEASLEQLFHMEADHFRKHKQYFDPATPEYRQYLPWLDQYDCEVRADKRGFAVIARADLDGDGQIGVWRIDESGPVVKRLVAD